MNTHQGHRSRQPATVQARTFRISPLAQAVAWMLAAGAASTMAVPAHAQRALGPAWFGAKGAAQATAAATGRLPNGLPVSTLTNPQAQQQQANAQLARSIDNLNLAARGIAAQQAAQAAARAAALAAGGGVPDGLAEGGLKVDTNSLTAGWLNANAPTQGTAEGRTNVAIQQTADKAILNWETFNVGRNTAVEFKQQADWAVLNRVNDPQARPSQIQGQIKGDGTVLIANRNGVVFSGTSQVDTRNLVAAAAHIADAQFNANGIYSNGSAPSFTGAQGRVEVQAGARLATLAPRSSTEGGGYVLLLGREVHNAGDIATPRGQAALAAGDGFVIRKGVGTGGNQASTTRGSEVTPQFDADSLAGQVTNSGLIVAREGDVTLAGREVRQNGAVLATTTVDTRGTVHLNALGSAGAVTLGQGAATAVVLEDKGTALDSQRDALRGPVAGSAPGIVSVPDRRDQSRIEITSGGTVDFEGDSLTLATGGQVTVTAARRSLVRERARIDVSGAVGVSLAMESNNVQVNVQGNEQRDAPVNRDGKGLNSNDVWIDRRSLVFVPKGTNGYESDRWYTAGGLLEVSGYLGTQGHTAGEWMAQGGTLSFGGQDVVTQAGSVINLSGGTLDVRTGFIHQTWLKGADGRLYEVSKAPGDQAYTGVYRGFEDEHLRWGKNATAYFYSPLIGPQKRLESGYTAGRDAGKLVIATGSAVLEGEITSEAFQGPRQTQAPQAELDGYNQSQGAAPRRGQLIVGQYLPMFDPGTGVLSHVLEAVMNQVVLRRVQEGIAAGLDLAAAVPGERLGKLVLDTDRLNGFALGAVRVAARDKVVVDAGLQVGAGGHITLYGNEVTVNADLTARGGSIQLGSVLNQVAAGGRVDGVVTPGAVPGPTTVGVGVTLDASGLWSNLQRSPEDLGGLPWQAGGSIAIRGAGDVVLQEGSMLDVSSGAALQANGKGQGGRGGSVTLEANAMGVATGGRLALGGDIRGHGVSGGGTLRLRSDTVVIGAPSIEQAGALVLAGGFFDKGFGRYDVVGGKALTVAEGTRIDVTLPVYRFTGEARESAGGSRIADALALWTPPLYREDPIAGVLTPRGGASLALAAGSEQTPAADLASVRLLIGRDASIHVDPGQAIEVRGAGQVDVDGTLSAPGGSLFVGSVRQPELLAAQPVAVDPQGHARAIRIGEHARLDVSARAATAVDAGGRRYGVVPNGGSIVIGGALDRARGAAYAPDQFVVVSEGARLDASGTRAALDIAGGGRVEVASDGGRIALSSMSGLVLDGGLRAAAGGAGAAGGTLSVALETGDYANAQLTDAVLAPRELVLSQARRPAAVIGADGSGLRYGQGRLSVEQVAQGGFGNLALLSQGMIGFEGDVALSVGQSLELYAASLGLSSTSPLSSKVVLDAPYVRLAGVVLRGRDNHTTPVVRGGSSTQATQATLSVHADLIDVRDEVNFGAHGTIARQAGPLAVDQAGFAGIALHSTGDMRMLGASAKAGFTRLNTPGELALGVAQLYPDTGASAVIRADHLVVGRSTEADPAVPYAVFGVLQLEARVIDQGGVVRAPLGGLNLGDPRGAFNTAEINLLPGSLTSVSAAGLTMPYGGTVDGQTYLYGGASLTDSLFGADRRGDFFRLTLSGQSVDVRPGAVVDLSGGGELTGAAFISGRGGSTDARFRPLVQVDARGRFSLPSLAGNPVYAIVPGVQPAYAPVGADGAADPAIGRQITIGAGVPGLPAGTYTLMPSTYALQKGAFRVELNGAAGRGAAAAPLAMRNGSWSASGRLSTAHTGIGDSLFSQVIVTPADVLRTYAQYNETGVAPFLVADAARLGVPRAALPADAQRLALNFLPNKTTRPSFNFEGIGRYAPAEGGHGSVASVLAGGSAIELLADGAAPTPGFVGTSLHAASLNAIGAASLRIGAEGSVTYGQGGNYVSFRSFTNDLIVRSGAWLSAPEVVLVTGKPNGGIVVEQGAQISTLGRGQPAFDSRDGFIFDPGASSLLAVSNGLLDVLAPRPGDSNDGPGSIRIGDCSAVCHGVTRLYSEGTIVAATDKAFTLGDGVRYGTRNLTLAVGSINAGRNESLAAEAARGALPAGLTLNQDVLARLLRGDTTAGAPALEALTLTARDAFNFYGTVQLDTTDAATGQSSLARLVLGAPALYGHGTADDVASIRTGNLIWNGATSPPGAVVAGGAGTGSGRLDIQAERIEFGYGPQVQTNNVASFDRLMLGFADVNLRASERITANHKGSLQVYRSQGAYEAGKGYSYTGGNLTLATPLVTGEAGSVNRITAGGDIRVMGVAGAAPAAVSALGGELSLQGRSIVVDTAVVLPSGKLTLRAERDLVLEAGAQLDLAGREARFNDIVKYSWGGDVVLESREGDIRQSGASRIDLSAKNNQGGRLTAVALDAGAGRVDLQGRILAGGSGHYDAGGTLVPYSAGGIDLRAQRVDDFAALNTRLNEGQVFGSRSFQLKQGDLRIGDEVKAREVNVSVDNGSLTVLGTIDASGERVGSIRLAGKNGLTLAGTAVLDAHGSRLRVDSYGKIIDSPNRAVVELSGGDGRLTLADGARIDLRHGTDAAVGTQPGQSDGQARGTLELNARRLGEIAGDIDIDASGRLDIRGARSIAVNGVWRYDDSDPDAVVRDGTGAASGRPYREITQAYLQRKHERSSAFIDAALANGKLMDGKLAGLNNATYADAFHLRPGVEIVTDKDLVVQGDLDLSGFRYASVNARTRKTDVYGSGEAGSLAIRAGGDLSLYGSINDGFAPPPVTPDDNGWLLLPGKEPFGGDVIVPGQGIVLADGTEYAGGRTLNYDLPIKGMAFGPGVVLPAPAVLAEPATLPAGTPLGGAVRDAAGQLLYAAGTVLAAPVTLPAGTRLDAGTRLSGASTALRAMVWPRGIPLPVMMNSSGRESLRFTLDGDLPLLQGALIPSETDVKLPGGAVSASLRPVEGAASQGRNWAIAPMLAEGAQSWSLRLVGGADTGAADTRAVRPREVNGSLVLADTHYTVFRDRKIDIIPGQPEQGAWQLGNFEDDPEWSWFAEVGYKNGDIANPDDAVWMCNGAPASICAFIPIPGTGTPDQTVVGEVNAVRSLAPVFSVLRTGTGDLDLVAGGDFAMRSLYGVYTAGTQSAGVEAAYNRPRSVSEGAATVLPNYKNGSFYLYTVQYRNGDEPGKTSYSQQLAAYEKLVDAGSLYQAWYPTQGGNLLLSVGGNAGGDVHSPDTLPGVTSESSVGVGRWLWRQGSGSAAVGSPVPTAWWINFGSYAGGLVPQVVGFTGIGALGGGNVDVRIGGDAGAMNPRGNPLVGARGRSEGLVLAVGGSGRVGGDGTLALTGGGDLDVRIGGGLNPSLAARSDARNNGNQYHDLNGALIDLRGSVRVDAGALGGIDLAYGRLNTQQDAREARAYDPFKASIGSATGGLVVVPGDATVSLSTRGDLVLGGTGDAGRVGTPYGSDYEVGGVAHGGGKAWFTLWTERTAIDLFSAGGNLTPSTQMSENRREFLGAPRGDMNASATDGRYIYPSILRAVAAGGSIYYGPSALYSATTLWLKPEYSLLLAPSDRGQLEVLAADSVYGGGYAITPSGASPRVMPTPLAPAFTGAGTDPVSHAPVTYVTNVSTEGISSLFAFGGDTAGGGHRAPRDPARFYAAKGDLVGVRTGEIIVFDAASRGGATWYEGAVPVWMMAGRDIVGSGPLLDAPTPVPLEMGGLKARSTGNLFVHDNPNDVSVVSAGRDILFSSFNVAGPGSLEITAGRNIRMEDKAAVTSLGAVAPGDRRPGAGISMLAGAGSEGVDYLRFVNAYLDPANRAQGGVPLAEQDGKVARTYEAELLAWLQDAGNGFDFEGTTTAQARAFFAGLPAQRQRIFARDVYFAELRAGGREYNDAASPRQGSYLRGCDAIARLFPLHDAQGGASRYAGDITLFGAAGINTLFGGGIQLLTPGGRQVFGIEGEAPRPVAGVVPGVITQGAGDIGAYALGSILLGQSRVMTTFGGGIVGWSAEGDINAGRGSKTTVVYTPPKRVYDQWGNVTLSSTVPSTGAGIATLAPIPEVPAGDIDLIAPLGTIDAGEAGIRVSGNVNLAALQVVNAANIAVKGEATGIPTVAAVNVGALTSASAAASQAAGAAQEVLQRERSVARQALPSVFTVRVLGFGNEAVEGGADGAAVQRRPAEQASYDPSGFIQVLGHGALTDAQIARLSDSERRGLPRGR